MEAMVYTDIVCPQASISYYNTVSCLWHA